MVDPNKREELERGRNVGKTPLVFAVVEGEPVSRGDKRCRGAGRYDMELARANCVETGEEAEYTHEDVEGDGRHEGDIEGDAQEARLEVEGPDGGGMGGVGVEKVRKVGEGLVRAAEDVDLGEEVLATDVEPVAADEGAGCKGVLAVAAKVVEDVAKELSG